MPFTPPARVQNNREPVSSHRPYPGHWRPRPGFDYCEGYYYGGIYYPVVFFGYGGWAPTDWIFIVGTQRWYSPGLGYYPVPPVVLSGPITVAVEEVVPVLDQFGNQEYDINGNPMLETITVYYNAYYDPAYGAYGYVDINGSFVWLSW